MEALQSCLTRGEVFLRFICHSDTEMPFYGGLARVKKTLSVMRMYVGSVYLFIKAVYIRFFSAYHAVVRL